MQGNKGKNIIQFICFALILTFGSSLIFSQDTPAAKQAGGDPDRVKFIVDDEALVTQELLGEHGGKGIYKVVIDNFEESGEWHGKMPNDQGFVSPRRQLGFPLALKGLPTDVNTVKERVKNPPKYRDKEGSYRSNYYPPYKDNRKYVLGVRVDFQRRGNNWFALYPYRPVKLAGLVKAFEVWVSGRQRNHFLSIIIKDTYGEKKIIPVGKLNFLGWKRLSVNVPDQVKQYDYRFGLKRGITFEGFLVTCSPFESWGKYYMYLDNFSAEVSRFWEENQDESDPVDSW